MHASRGGMDVFHTFQLRTTVSITPEPFEVRICSPTVGSFLLRSCDGGTSALSISDTLIGRPHGGAGWLRWLDGSVSVG